MPAIDASPERIARAFLAAAKPPDPSLRVRQPGEREPHVSRRPLPREAVVSSLHSPIRKEWCVWPTRLAGSPACADVGRDVSLERMLIPGHVRSRELGRFAHWFSRSSTILAVAAGSSSIDPCPPSTATTRAPLDSRNVISASVSRPISRSVVP